MIKHTHPKITSTSKRKGSRKKGNSHKQNKTNTHSPPTSRGGASLQRRHQVSGRELCFRRHSEHPASAPEPSLSERNRGCPVPYLELWPFYHGRKQKPRWRRSSHELCVPRHERRASVRHRELELQPRGQSTVPKHSAAGDNEPLLTREHHLHSGDGRDELAQRYGRREWSGCPEECIRAAQLCFGGDDVRDAARGGARAGLDG